VASPLKNGARMASRQLSKEQHTGSGAAVDGRGHGSRRQLARRRDAPTRRTAWQGSGRQADLQPSLRGRNDGKTRLKPPSSIALVDSTAGFPKRLAIVRRSTPLPFWSEGIALPHHSGGPDEPERSGFGPFPITRSLSRMDQSAELSTDATNLAQDPSGQQLDLPH